MAWEEWTTAQIALVVSGLSFLLSFSSFVWNVWSKFIYPKPRVEVRIRFSILVGEGSNDHPGAVTLECLNHGPGEIYIKSALGLINDGFILSKSKRGLLRAYQNWPQSIDQMSFGEVNGLPARLTVGEGFLVNFPESILKSDGLKNLRFQDSFGRVHFAKLSGRRALRQAARQQK